MGDNGTCQLVARQSVISRLNSNCPNQFVGDSWFYNDKQLLQFLLLVVKWKMGLVSFLMGAWCNWKMTLGVSLNSHLCSSQILGLVPDQEQPMKLQSGIFGNKKQHFNCAAQSNVMSCKPKNSFICTITRFRHSCKPKDSGEQDYINTPRVPVYLCKSRAQGLVTFGWFLVLCHHDEVAKNF